MAPGEPSDVTVDGRRARRERGRRAVIDAMVDLIQVGHSPPTAQDIADRAGVSVSSLFRYFDTLDDLRDETTARFFERYAPLFEVPDIGVGPLDDRVARYVAARADLYEAIAPISRLVRGRVLEHPQLATHLSRVRHQQVEQVRAHFGSELGRRGRAAGHDLVATVAVLTSFEAWDLEREELDRSPRQVRRSWTSALLALLADY